MVILFDRFNLPEDVLEIIFSTRQQVLAAGLLIEEFKKHDGELGKTQMGMFASSLHDGVDAAVPSKENPSQRQVEEISYNKRQFYDRILTPMKTMGMVDYDNYKKTYILSNKFNKMLMKIGLMWTREMRKPGGGLLIKDD